MIENNDFELYQSIHVFFLIYYYYLVHFSNSQKKKKKIVSFPISFLIS